MSATLPGMKPGALRITYVTPDGRRYEKSLDASTYEIQGDDWIIPLVEIEEERKA